MVSIAIDAQRMHITKNDWDVCPEEVLLEGEPNRWHTVAVVFPALEHAPPGLLSTVDPFQEVATAFRKRNVHLREMEYNQGNSLSTQI